MRFREKRLLKRIFFGLLLLSDRPDELVNGSNSVQIMKLRMAVHIVCRGDYRDVVSAQLKDMSVRWKESFTSVRNRAYQICR